MATMIKVPAVQYMLPNGRRVDVMVSIPVDLEPAYIELTERGCHLTSEVLINGIVSLTVEHDMGDFAVELTPNGPGIRDATRRLLEQWDVDAFDAWLETVQGVEAS